MPVGWFRRGTGGGEEILLEVVEEKEARTHGGREEGTDDI